MSESSVNPIDWRYFWVDSKENEEKMKSDAFWHLLIYLWVSNILAKKIQWSMLNNSSGKLELNSTEQKKRVFFHRTKWKSFSEWRFYFDDEIKKNRHPFLRVEMRKQSQTVQVFRLLKSLQRAEGLFFHLWKGSVCPKQIVRNWMATRHRSYSGFKLCTVFTIFN